jgi:uracil-DNA glycosylase
MTTLSSRLDKKWRDIIGGEFDRSKMEKLEKFLQRLERFLQKERGESTIYPNDGEIFNALNLTPFKKVKVVIIGQDPYHGEGEAHGLCFSTKEKEIPPSLRNIYNEIEAEYGIRPDHGDLTGWAKQGVLLLNATLTVQKDKAGSHQGKGWEKFTDAIIRAISAKREHVVFLLWGHYALEKSALIDCKRHRLLKASHPSGFSARRDLRNGEIHKFVGCGHFKTANEYLKEHGLKRIVWERI